MVIITGRGRVFNSRGGTNTSTPDNNKIKLLYADGNRKWKRPHRAQTDYMWNEGWLGSFIGKSYIYLSCLEKGHMMCPNFVRISDMIVSNS